MVFFVCDKCGESLKKNQVEKHCYRCRFTSVSCVDCNAVFPGESYREHVKCISEDQKYGGKNYVAKENKGEVKQNAWVEQVEAAVAAVTDPALSRLLNSILGFTNIPRKEAKFVNFLQNSVKIRDRDLCIRAWKAIADAAQKMKEKEKKAAEQVEEKDEKEINKEKKQDGGERRMSPDSTTQGEPQQFKWKKAIKRRLREEGGEMRLKKLRKAVVAEYRDSLDRDEEVDEQELNKLFAEKLPKAK